jgi:hypothetical protein
MESEVLVNNSSEMIAGYGNLARTMLINSGAFSVDDSNNEHSAKAVEVLAEILSEIYSQFSEKT